MTQKAELEERAEGLLQRLKGPLEEQKQWETMAKIAEAKDAPNAPDLKQKAKIAEDKVIGIVTRELRRAEKRGAQSRKRKSSRPS